MKAKHYLTDSALRGIEQGHTPAALPFSAMQGSNGMIHLELHATLAAALLGALITGKEHADGELAEVYEMLARAIADVFAESD